MSLDLVATCALGLEEILADELRALDAAAVQTQTGAVAYAGDWPMVWRTNWRLRTANRVLVALDSWPADSGEAIEEGVKALVRDGRRAWDGLEAGELFQPHRTFAFRSTTRRSQVRDTRWVNLKAKDGLVDGQRLRYGRRGSVDRDDPDLHLRVLLQSDRATLLLDTSGEPLDRRGYRRQTTTAPVREQIAAACVLTSGWDGRGPVVDPMCGSGTLLAEAAWIALGRAPGSLRRRWAFERFPGFDAERFAAVRREPQPVPGPEVRIFGIDHSAEAIAAARHNLEAAGLTACATLTTGDGFAFEPPPGPGLLLVNPPFGERIEEDPAQWKRLGDLFKQRYKGWRAAVLAAGPSRGKHIGLRPSRRLPLRHGPLDARILVFEIY